MSLHPGGREVTNDPHFEVIVHKQVNEEVIYKAYNDIQQLHDPAAARRAVFYEHDLRSDQPHSQARMLMEQQSVNTTLITKFKEIHRYAGSVVVDFVDRVPTADAERKLREVAAVLAKVDAGAVELVLYRNPDSKVIDTHSVQSLLGNRHPQRFEELADASMVQVRVGLAKEYMPPHYSTARHEFGHMLGNVDVYRERGMCHERSAGTRTRRPTCVIQSSADRGKKNDSALVNDAGLAAQAPLVGITSSSIMSMGNVVLRTDYLTLWEALTRITAPDVDRRFWKIS